MANALNPFGFQALRHASGGEYSRINQYTLAAGYATSLYEGDVVKSSGGNVALAAPGDAILGTFKGVEYIEPDGTIKFDNKWRASTATRAGEKIVVHVQDDAGLTFKVQTNATVNYADRGKFVDLVAAAGDALTGRSKMAVGAPGGAASQYQIMRVLDGEPMLIAGNVVGMPTDGQYAVLEVKAVKHERSGAAAGIAV
ncbi:MAG: hypothetical protein ABL908_09565 [Hyphomicrobium sp.]